MFQYVIKGTENMKRYIKLSVLIIFVGIIVCSCLGTKEEQRPDIYLVSIDTLRADYVGCYGNPDIHTPVIDYLSRRGSMFSEVASSVPITLPAHSTIMTGYYPPAHGVRNNGLYKLDEKFVILQKFSGAQATINIAERKAA